MSDLIPINYDSDRQTTSARALWEFLDKPWGEFMKWFSKFSEYGFTQNVDYKVIEQSFENPQGGRPATDYEITIQFEFFSKNIGLITEKKTTVSIVNYCIYQESRTTKRHNQ